MRLTELTPEYVHFMPEKPAMKEGILYISREFGSVQHRCACGCGEIVVTPIDTVQWWTLREEDEGRVVTLWPSIGRFQSPCKSHYFITKNKIEWC